MAGKLRLSVMENQSQASIDLLDSPLSGVSDEVENTPEGEIGKMVVVGATPDEEYEVKRDKGTVGVNSVAEVLQTLHANSISVHFVKNTVERATGTKGEKVYIVTSTARSALPRSAVRVEAEVLEIPNTKDYVLYVTTDSKVQVLKQTSSANLFFKEMATQAAKLIASLEPKLVQQWVKGFDELINHYEANPTADTFELVTSMMLEHQAIAPTAQCNAMAAQAFKSLVKQNSERTGNIPIVSKSIKKLRLPRRTDTQTLPCQADVPRIEPSRLVFKKDLSPSRRVIVVASESDSDEVSPLRVPRPPSKKVRFNSNANEIRAIFESDTDSSEDYVVSQEVPLLRRRMVSVDSTPLKLGAGKSGGKGKVKKGEAKDILTQHLKRKEELYDEGLQVKVPSKQVDEEIKKNQKDLARLARITKKTMNQRDPAADWSHELELQAADDEDDDDDNSMISLLEEFKEFKKRRISSQDDIKMVAQAMSKIVTSEPTPKKTKTAKPPEDEPSLSDSSGSEDVMSPPHVDKPVPKAAKPKGKKPAPKKKKGKK